MEGSRLGPNQLLAELGSGGMGKITGRRWPGRYRPGELRVARVSIMQSPEYSYEAPTRCVQYC